MLHHARRTIAALPPNHNNTKKRKKKKTRRRKRRTIVLATTHPPHQPVTMETPKKSVAAAASSSSVASTAAPPGSKSGTSTSSSNSNAATTTTAATTTATINSALAATAAAPCGKEAPTEAQRNIQRFWPGVMREIQQIEYVEPGNQLLPLARIKKIMKLDEEVKMISSDAPLLFSKAIEIFIQELTLRAWLHTEHNKRRTLQRSDIAMAITKYDQFDFLIDIVPRDEIKGSWKVFDGPAQDECAAGGGGGPASTGGGEAVASASTATTSEGAAGGTNGTADDMQYIMQLAQQHRLVQPGTDKGSCTATTNTTSTTATTSSLTNGATTVLDLATVMTGTQQLHQLSTVAAVTKPAKGVVAGTEQETAGATLLPSPAQVCALLLDRGGGVPHLQASLLSFSVSLPAHDTDRDRSEPHPGERGHWGTGWHCER